jgi:rare lipoprotein A (peptidoglycan hydrolase)
MSVICFWLLPLYPVYAEGLIEPKLYESKNEKPPAQYSRRIFRQVNVSWYGKGRNRDGTAFDPTRLTAACWDEFPKGTQFKVRYGANSVVVSCTDRGGFRSLGRMLDLSSGAFKTLAPLNRGVIKVDIEVL